MRTRNASKFIISFVVVLMMLGVALAQTTAEKKAQYDAKAKELKEVSMKMGAQGVTADEYAELKKQYDALSAEIKTLQTALSADQE